MYCVAPVVMATNVHEKYGFYFPYYSVNSGSAGPGYHIGYDPYRHGAGFTRYGIDGKHGDYGGIVGGSVGGDPYGWTLKAGGSLPRVPYSGLLHTFAYGPYPNYVPVYLSGYGIRDRYSYH